jgi:hypothetical protein
VIGQGRFIDGDYVGQLGRGELSAASRTLDVLAAIDQTCGALRAETDAMRLHERRLHEVIGQINALPPGPELEPAARLDVFRAAQALLEQAVESLQHRCEAASRAPELREDDGVVDAYEAAIAAARELHAAIGELVFAVLEHDADRSPAGPVFASADELIAALKS